MPPKDKSAWTDKAVLGVAGESPAAFPNDCYGSWLRGAYPYGRVFRYRAIWEVFAHELMKTNKLKQNTEKENLYTGKEKQPTEKEKKATEKRNTSKQKMNKMYLQL